MFVWRHSTASACTSSTFSAALRPARRPLGCRVSCCRTCRPVRLSMRPSSRDAPAPHLACRPAAAACSARPGSRPAPPPPRPRGRQGGAMRAARSRDASRYGDRRCGRQGGAMRQGAAAPAAAPAACPRRRARLPLPDGRRPSTFSPNLAAIRHNFCRCDPSCWHPHKRPILTLDAHTAQKTTWALPRGALFLTCCPGSVPMQGPLCAGGPRRRTPADGLPPAARPTSRLRPTALSARALLPLARMPSPSVKREAGPPW